MDDDNPDKIARLAQAYWQDPAAQDAAALPQDRHAALSVMAGQAQDWGIGLDTAALGACLMNDPVGIGRFAPRPANATQPPGPGWLPAGLAAEDGAWLVDWAHFGDTPLTEPFFEQPLRQARNRPITHLLRPRTPLAALAQGRDLADAPLLDGLVFHMSRCGSTLVAQALGVLDKAVVLSEPSPLDDLIQLLCASVSTPLDVKVTLLRAMVAALTGDRGRVVARRFIKVDCWHTAALPLFRAAFPQTPWVFLYRDPTQVMLSQQRMPGMQTLPGPCSALLGVDGDGQIPGPAFTARVLAAVCNAAADHAGVGGGLFVDYAGLDHAMAACILPHFGIVPDTGEQAAMARVKARDAKAPGQVFDPAAYRATQEQVAALAPVVSHELAPAVARVHALSHDLVA